MTHLWSLVPELQEPYDLTQSLLKTTLLQILANFEAGALFWK